MKSGIDLIISIISVNMIYKCARLILVEKTKRPDLENAGILCLLIAVLAEQLNTYIIWAGRSDGFYIRIGLLLYLFCIHRSRHRQYGSPGLSDRAAAQERQRILQQMNPHFLFNALGAIRIMTKTDADLAYDRIYDFSRYLRAIFKLMTSNENILFKEEIAVIISYTNLEKLRFGDGIELHVDMKEEDFLVPILSVQPLVENAVRHGLKKGRRNGTVTVRSFQTRTDYIVQVEDDGTGFDMEEYDRGLCRGKIEPGGLQNVRSRIENMTGGSMDIKSIVGSGTVITLHIPKVSRKPEADERKRYCNEDENHTGRR